jgi:hypothetical protein
MPEYPNLEALLEAQEGTVSYDYQVLSRVIPGLVAGVGSLVFIGLALAISPFYLLGVLGFGVLAAGLWFVLDSLDKRIPRSRAQLRKLGEEIWKRYQSFANMVGQPALAPSVCEVLDEAASIYLKHSNETEAKQSLQGEARIRAVQALEEAMARLLELGKPTSVQAQELELQVGWARPLLQEMRDTDKALTHHLQTALAAQAINTADPLSNLRDARMELLGNENAMIELEQDQRGT